MKQSCKEGQKEQIIVRKKKREIVSSTFLREGGENTSNMPYNRLEELLSSFLFK